MNVLEKNILTVQRFYRLKFYFTLLKKQSILHNEDGSTFEQVQTQILQKHTRKLMFFIAEEIQKLCQLRFSLHSSKLVNVVLSLYLIYHQPHEVLSQQLHSAEEKRVYVQAQIAFRLLHRKSSSWLASNSMKVFHILNTYISHFQNWILFDKTQQLCVLSELIIQLRTHGPNTTDKQVQESYKECARSFEEKIFEHVKKIAGDDGYTFVCNCVKGVEEAQQQISRTVNSTMHKVYWDILSQQLENKETQSTCMILIAKTFREKFLTLTTNETLKKRIITTIDISLYEMQMINKTFTFGSFLEILENIVQLTLHMCAPVQDVDLRTKLEEIKELHEHRLSDSKSKIINVCRELMTHLEYIQRYTNNGGM